jgi:hypothetical protein
MGKNSEQQPFFSYKKEEYGLVRGGFLRVKCSSSQ